MLKRKVYNLLEKGEHGHKINRIFDYFITSLILLSVISILIESFDQLQIYQRNYLKIFNLFTIVIFTIEYLLRIYISDISHPSSNRFKSVLKFIFSWYGVIDLISILPFYLPILIKVDLRFLRILRFTRFFRLFKISRYNDAFSIIASVIKEKKSELALTAFIAFKVLILASFLMYFFEGNKQPEKFSNILESLWWAVATLTTVGYGDVYPVTGIGKLISGFIAIMGIGLVALPTGIISAGFINKLDERKHRNKFTKCPKCGEKIVK